MTKVSHQINSNVGSVSDIRPQLHTARGVKAVGGCSSGVKVEAFASIINDKRAQLDGVLGSGIGKMGVCSMRINR